MKEASTMSSTTKKIDVWFSVIPEKGPHGNFETKAVKSAAEKACEWKMCGWEPSLWIQWIGVDGQFPVREIPITTTRDTTARLSSLKKMIQAGEPIDG
jgi:hypothetical protein